MEPSGITIGRVRSLDTEVLDQTRFDAASELLQDPDIKVTDVALQLGYSDSAHFSRAFKRVAGVNPRVYRQAYSH